MIILMLAQFYPPAIGGEERHVRNLAQELARRGHEVHVATQPESSNQSSEGMDGSVALHFLQSTAGRLPFLYSEQARRHALPLPDPEVTSQLARLVRRIKPDVVHGHNWFVNSFLPLQLRTRRPLVVTLHDYSLRCATKRLVYQGAICQGPAVRKCLECSGGHYGPAKGAVIAGAVAGMRPAKKHLVDRFLCVSNSVALGNALATSGAKTEILPNFIPDDLVTDASEALPSRSDALPQNDYFLFVGDLTREKGLLTLLAAYEGLADSGISLLLVGRRSQGTPSTLPAGVVLGESWPHDRVVSAFRHARAAILPSEWADPCPTTVLEAMALRTPVVTTALGGMIDMVTDGVSGVVVPPGEAEPLRAAMRRLLTDADLGPRLVAGAAEKVREFTASRVVDRLEDVYREVVDSRPAVRGLQ